MRSTTMWPLAVVQTCVLHLIRNTFRYASRKYWDAMTKDLRPVYTARPRPPRSDRFDEFADNWGDRYPAIIRLWDNAWTEFVPFLDYDVEIRRVICTHQRHRVRQRPLPARGPGPRPLPHRAGRPEMPLPRHPSAGPHRQRQGTMGHTMEARPERLRHHLRRKNQLNANRGSTENRTVPTWWQQYSTPSRRVRMKCSQMRRLCNSRPDSLHPWKPSLRSRSP